MTQKTRTDLYTEISALIADAPAANISALDVRTTLINSKDSNFNILDDDSDDLTEGTSKLLMTAMERVRVAYEWQTQSYIGGVNYTPGTTTALTMPAAAPSNDKDYVRVSFEGVLQDQSGWSVLGTTITFTSA